MSTSNKFDYVQAISDLYTVCVCPGAELRACYTFNFRSSRYKWLNPATTFPAGDCLLDNLKMEMWEELILIAGVLTTAKFVAEDSLFTTVLMKYSVSNAIQVHFLCSMFVCYSPNF